MQEFVFPLHNFSTSFDAPLQRTISGYEPTMTHRYPGVDPGNGHIGNTCRRISY